MATFQAKTGWKIMRKIKNKNYRSVSFLPDEQQKIQKNLKKPLRIHFKPKLVGEG